jgi:hypothetical protein
VEGSSSCGGQSKRIGLALALVGDHAVQSNEDANKNCAEVIRLQTFLDSLLLVLLLLLFDMVCRWCVVGFN